MEFKWSIYDKVYRKLNGLITLFLAMGVSIEQWRCAIGSTAPLFRTVKIEQNHDGMLSKIQNDSFKLWSFVGVTMLWLILGNWVMMTWPLGIGMSEITTNVRSTYVTGTICERTNENVTLTVELMNASH